MQTHHMVQAMYGQLRLPNPHLQCWYFVAKCVCMGLHYLSHVVVNSSCNQGGGRRIWWTSIHTECFMPPLKFLKQKLKVLTGCEYEYAQLPSVQTLQILMLPVIILVNKQVSWYLGECHCCFWQRIYASNEQGSPELRSWSQHKHNLIPLL